MRCFPVQSKAARRAGVAVIAALLGPIYVLADTVSGHVFNQDEKPAANMTLTAKPAKGDPVQFKTDAAGAFSVYLDPGRYTVSPSNDASMQGVVNSVPQPVQQDVHLKKGAS